VGDADAPPYRKPQIEVRYEKRAELTVSERLHG
jgi:hypothetical protein